MARINYDVPLGFIRVTNAAGNTDQDMLIPVSKIVAVSSLQAEGISLAIDPAAKTLIEIDSSNYGMKFEVLESIKEVALLIRLAGRK